jgi:hypothetical protein
VVEPPVAGDVSLRLIGQLGGRIGPTVAADGHLFAAVGNQVVVLSLADPADPRQVGASPVLPEVVEGLAVSGQLLLAAAGPAGLLVLDVSSPTRPAPSGALALPGHAEDVAASGELAYVADGTGGLRIVDVSDPADPTQVGVAYDLHNVLGVDVAGGHAYLAAADEGLLVADVSDPAAPAQLGGLRTGAFAHRIDVSGSVAYLADAWGGLRTIEVSDPASPTLLGRSKVKAWAMDVMVIGGRAYLAAGSQGLRVIDVANPEQPVLVGARAMPAGHAAHVLVRKRVAYVADIFTGVRAIDVSRPEKPKVAGGYVPAGTAGHVALHDRHAFVSALTFGERIVDVSDPGSPREVGSLLASGQVNVETAAPVGDLAFVTTGLGPRPSEMVTLDISDVTRPVILSRYGFPVIRATAVQGTTLYYPNEFGLLIVEGSIDPPCLLSFLQLSELPCCSVGVGLAGDLAYLAEGNLGLHVLDISDPRQPRVLDVLATERAFALLAVGDTLFAYSGAANDLRSFDISDPIRPIALDTVQLPAQPRFFHAVNPLAYAGGRLFVANDNAGLVVVDVSQPGDLRIAGRLRLPGRAVSVAADPTHAYVASIGGGLSVVEWTGLPAAPTVSEATGSRARDLDGSHRRASSSTGSATRCVVRTTNDSGPGSLRACLSSAVEGTRITFDTAVFPASAPARIRLESELPGIGPPITLDGSGAGVILDGRGQVATGLSTAGPSTIRGLRIENFTRAGIELGGTGTIVRDNVISGNGEFGIFVCCSQGHDGRNTIAGNLIGTDPSGTAAGGSQTFGIQLNSHGNTVGGPRPRDRNVISGNVEEMNIDSGDGNKIIGNYFRTDVTGSSVLSVPDASPAIGITTGARNQFVDNVIAGGVFVSDHGAFYNSFVGNHIGFDVIGEEPFEEPHTGLFVGEPFTRVEDNLLPAIDFAAHDGIALGNRVMRGAGSTAVAGIESHGGRQNVIGGRSSRGANLLTMAGIRLLEGARDNVVLGNQIDGGDPDGVGISIVGSGQNSIAGNEIVDAPRGRGSPAGTGPAGILLRDGAWANVVRGNVVRSSGTGVWALDSEGNLFSLNAFVDNATQATDEGTGNLWDDGALGNFWSDHAGPDADGDGVVDTPRPVPPNGVDRFPLVAPPPELVLFAPR